MKRSRLASVLAVTLASATCGGPPTAPSIETPARVLIISPVVAFMKPGESASFTVFVATQEGGFVAEQGTWSVDNPAIAALTADRTFTARAEGRTSIHVVTASGSTQQPVVVSADAPRVWTGTYTPTSCTSDCAPCCSMSMKDAFFPRPFRLTFATAGDRVTGVLTLLAGGGINESNGVVDGAIASDTLQFPRSSFMVQGIGVDRQFCCIQAQNFVISATRQTGTFTEIHGDPRRPIGQSLTFAQAIGTVNR
jgi:hypothetical protein